MVHETQFGNSDALKYLRTPLPSDDKYSRGVVGFVSGSEQYPGAAVLGVTAALSVGVGMVRFLSSAKPTSLVLGARPEVVIREGHVDAWVLGSGIDSSERSDQTTESILAAFATGAPCVVDAGALDLIDSLEDSAPAGTWVVITPHAHELARMFTRAGTEVSVNDIMADPAAWAQKAAQKWKVSVLLKGAETVVVDRDDQDSVILPAQGSAWLATAGTGDVLAGAIGAVLAGASVTHASAREFTGCVAAAATLHANASRSLPAPFTALTLADALGAARRALSAPPKR